MTDWKQANRMLREGYDTRVPDYDLKPVLELISGIEPKEIVAAMTEALISITDGLLLGNRKSNVRTQETVSILKEFIRAFDEVFYDRNSFTTQQGEQIANEEGIYSKEPLIIYPQS